MEAVSSLKALAEVLSNENHNQRNFLDQAKDKCNEIAALKRQFEVTQNDFSKFQDIMKSSLDKVKKGMTGIQSLPTTLTTIARLWEILGVPFEDRTVRKHHKDVNDEAEFKHLLPQQSYKKRRTTYNYNLPCNAFLFSQNIIGAITEVKYSTSIGLKMKKVLPQQP